MISCQISPIQSQLLSHSRKTTSDWKPETNKIRSYSKIERCGRIISGLLPLYAGVYGASNPETNGTL